MFTTVSTQVEIADKQLEKTGAALEVPGLVTNEPGMVESADEPEAAEVATEPEVIKPKVNLPSQVDPPLITDKVADAKLPPTVDEKKVLSPPPNFEDKKPDVPKPPTKEAEAAAKEIIAEVSAPEQPAEIKNTQKTQEVKPKPLNPKTETKIEFDETIKNHGRVWGKAAKLCMIDPCGSNILDVRRCFRVKM